MAGVKNQYNEKSEYTKANDSKQQRKPFDLHSPEAFPFLKEFRNNFISNQIGNYYYSCLLGKNFNQEEILYEEGGRWYWKGKLIDISLLLEEFRKIYGKNAKFKEGRLLNLLKKIDGKVDSPVGHKILEIFAEILPAHYSYMFNKQHYMEKVKTAKAILRKKRNAKKSILKKFQDQPNETERLTQEIDKTIAKSDAAFALLGTFLAYSSEGLPDIPPVMKMNKPQDFSYSEMAKGQFKNIANKFNKEYPFITKLRNEVHRLPGIETRMTGFEIDRHISSLLRYFNIDISADSLRKRTVRKSK